MKRLHPARIIVALLLFATSSIPTSSFALSYDLQLEVVYYANGVAVGRAVYNSCFGHLNYSSGTLSGTLKLERYTDCDDGTTRCDWYEWTGSGWALVVSGNCTPSGNYPRPPRQLP